MKSLRRHGIFTVAEAVARSSREPWKNSPLVSTERAAAPADSKLCARAAGEKSLRIRPFEGEAFLISEMIAGPSLATVRSPLAKPRGVWVAALRSSRP